MTLSDLRTRILDGLSESSSSPVHFSASQINDSINEALEVLAEQVDAVRRTAFVPLREGTTYYYTRSIASDMMVPYRIWSYDQTRKLTAISVHDLDEFSTSWDETTGAPESWFPISWDCFGLYPYPASAGGVLRVDYFAWPRELAEDGDELELPEASQDAIIDYGIYDGLVKRYDLQTAMRFLSAFSSLFKDAKARSGIKKQGSSAIERSMQPHREYRSSVREDTTIR